MGGRGRQAFISVKDTAGAAFLRSDIGYLFKRRYPIRLEAEGLSNSEQARRLFTQDVDHCHGNASRIGLRH